MTEEPGTRMDPRVARTRAVVLDAAIDLLAERGYSGFSVEGVVDRTGVAKTTLYRHWPTRDDLLAAVAVANGLPVYTCNADDFDGIDGLHVVPVSVVDEVTA